MINISLCYKIQQSMTEAKLILLSIYTGNVKISRVTELCFFLTCKNDGGRRAKRAFLAQVFPILVKIKFSLL